MAAAGLGWQLVGHGRVNLRQDYCLGLGQLLLLLGRQWMFGIKPVRPVQANQVRPLVVQWRDWRQDRLAQVAPPATCSWWLHCSLSSGLLLAALAAKGAGDPLQQTRVALLVVVRQWRCLVAGIGVQRARAMPAHFLRRRAWPDRRLHRRRLDRLGPPPAAQ
ncbi:hypothetical protein DL89DRAFT_58403 [Linderina pennispora]|uniref:Uncharacterized protein n=1 Tax=Linderina pennispora TaxID=61395 RepID=A0A1Y1VZK7_9FUNG|nr:uncharacterized protein DL89DRAFT_58403 [Linderina pennispora]ORX66698.1 hypothetical protein DL89DRAFT_58403 [Linderina pennispora]